MAAFSDNAKALIVCAAVVSALTLAIEPASAQIAKDQAARQLESAYGVTVLRVREIDNEGKPAFAVTVMNPPGNYNEAFQVNTVVVDAATGTLVRQFREATNGVRTAAPPVGQRTSPRTAETP